MPHAGGAVWCRGSAAVGGTGRRALRGPGAPAGGRGRTETPPQHSQRVLLAKLLPRRRGDVERAWERRAYVLSGGGEGSAVRARARGTMPRTAPMARRRDGDIAPYRNGARGDAHGEGHERGAREGRGRGAGEGSGRKTREGALGEGDAGGGSAIEW